jgi:hypothetical protein
MQKSKNKENFKIYYGYTCPCCRISKEYLKYRSNRSKHKEDAKNEINGLVSQLEEESGLNPVQCEFESRQG